jgi:hypothetical protein
MLTLTGQILNVIPGENKDRNTGEITRITTVEILHQSRGRSVVESVKCDIEVTAAWTKLIGKNISVEVRMYAMKTGEGGVTSGLTLADKKALPFVQNDHHVKAA